MKTTPTSSLPTATLAAFSDELEKIALSDENKKKAKRWVKNTAIVAGGYGAGHAAGMLAEKAVTHAFGEKFKKLQPATKMKLVGPALGLATAGSAAASLYFKKKREEADHE